MTTKSSYNSDIIMTDRNVQLRNAWAKTAEDLRKTFEILNRDLILNSGNFKDAVIACAECCLFELKSKHNTGLGTTEFKNYQRCYFKKANTHKNPASKRTGYGISFEYSADYKCEANLRHNISYMFGEDALTPEQVEKFKKAVNYPLEDLRAEILNGKK